MSCLRTPRWLVGKYGQAKSDHSVCRTLLSQSRWSKNFDSEYDWNIVTEPNPGLDNRCIKVSRGKFLGGSSNVNGTLCVRGTKQDFDDWGLEGWTGNEVWENMRKVTDIGGRGEQ